MDQTRRINARRHRLLRFGKNFSEMESPKLLWIKEHLPVTWNVAKFFDLADFLTYRAPTAMMRRNCTPNCKWAFDGLHGTWDKGFYTTSAWGIC